MIKLFKYEDYNVKVEPEAILLKPFRKIYNRDRSESKNKAMLELAFIYFYCDPRSDYQYIINEEDRLKAIVEGEGLSKDFKIDKDLQEAIGFYLSFKPASALLLEDTKGAVDKLRTFLRGLDLTKLDDKGKPIYPINTITSAIKQIPSLVEELHKAEKAINSELKEMSKMRGEKDKTMFEDGIDISL